MLVYKQRQVILWINLGLNFLLCLSLKDKHFEHCVTKPKKIIDIRGADIIIGALAPVHAWDSNQQGQRIYRLNRYALTWVEAIIFEINKINNNTNLLPGIKLGYDIRDSCNDEELALHIALDFVLDVNNWTTNTTESKKTQNLPCFCGYKRPYVTAVIGGAASPISTSVANVFGADFIPQISYSSTSTHLSKKEFYRSFLRTIPSDVYQAQAIVTLMIKFKWTYVSILASDSTYGRSGLAALNTEMKRHGICIAVEALFHPEVPEQQVTGIIDELKRETRTNVIVLWSQRPYVIDFFKLATKYGLAGKTWIGTDTWGDADEIMELNELTVGGMLGILPYPGAKNEEFESHLNSLTPENSENNPWMAEFWEKEFDCKHADGTPLSSNKTSNSTIVCEKHSESGLPSGKYLPRNKYVNVFDAVQAIAYGLGNLTSCTDGKGLLQGGKCPELSPFIKPEDLLVYIQNTSFWGHTGTVIEFDKNGDLKVGDFVLKNLQKDFQTGKLKFEKVGVWHGADGVFSVQAERILWNGWVHDPPLSRCSDVCIPGEYKVSGSKECCWRCVKCPQGQVAYKNGMTKCHVCGEGWTSNKNRTQCIELRANFLKLADAITGAILMMTATGALCTSLVLGVFIRFRDTPLVKASDFELSMLQLLCLLFIFVSPAFYIGRPTATICATQPYVFGIPFTIVTGTMLLKTDRLVRIFHQKTRLQRHSKLLSNRIQLILSILMTLVPVSIATIWLVAHPPQVERRDNIAEFYQVIDCGLSYVKLQICIISFVLFLALVCTYMAFKARNLPENFNEARYIGFSMFSLCLFWLGFIPAFYDSAGATQTFVFCLATNLSSLAILVIMYGHKIRIILLQPEKNQPEVFRKNMATLNSMSAGSKSGSPAIKHNRVINAPKKELGNRLEDIRLSDVSSSALSQ